MKKEDIQDTYVEHICEVCGEIFYSELLYDSICSDECNDELENGGDVK